MGPKENVEMVKIVEAAATGKKNENAMAKTEEKEQWKVKRKVKEEEGYL